MLKQVILVRKDLNLPKGKLSAQVAHASLEAFLKTQKKDKKLASEWRTGGAKKVVLRVENKKELLKFKQILDDAGFITSLIIDAGHTVLAPNTMTCLGVGPDYSEKLDNITGHLKMV